MFRDMRFEGNKIYCFTSDQSLSDFLYSWEFIKSRCNGGHRPTIAGDIALLPSDVIYLWNIARTEILAGNSFIVRFHETSN